MKKNSNSVIAGLMMTLLITVPSIVRGQSEKAFVKKYLSELSTGPVSNTLAKYRMTAVYTNRDLYGNFTGKTKVSGEYIRGLENGNVRWNNVFISTSNKLAEPFPEGKKQEYMENMTYVPSSKMLEKESFKNFPAGVETVFVKNLIWDMGAVEDFAWKFRDSLKLNKFYVIRPDKESFDMADVGKYSHNNIQIRWAGVSEVNNELCAVIEYRAVDNLLEIDLGQIKGKGTEQYWGTTWISLKTGIIQYADTYSGTIQEIQVKGMDNKFLVKTIREITVDKIQ
jgi:hypothetical protein